MDELEERYAGDSVPGPLGFIAMMPIPVNDICSQGSFFTEPQPWSWPRSRRSGCVPAEPYPPPRSLEEYSREPSNAITKRKKQLTFAALADMVDIRQQLSQPRISGQRLNPDTSKNDTKPFIGLTNGHCAALSRRSSQRPRTPLRPAPSIVRHVRDATPKP